MAKLEIMGIDLRRIGHEPDIIPLSCSSGARWCDGSSDQSFMVDPLSYFSFQPVPHDWCNKGRDMC